MSPRERAAAAYAAAELAEHPRDKAALRSAAAAWKRLAGPGVAWSTKDLSRELRALRIDAATAAGPFQPPKPPQTPALAVNRHLPFITRQLTPEPVRETIQF